MTEYEHKKFGKVRFVFDAETLTQRAIEGFTAAYQAQNGVSDKAGKLVRAAAQAGWFAEPVLAAAAIPDLPARQVRWYSQLIEKLYDEATTVDPKDWPPPPPARADAAN